MRLILFGDGRCSMNKCLACGLDCESKLDLWLHSWLAHKGVVLQ